MIELKFRTITHKDWISEGIKLFGDNFRDWKFVCPACGYVAVAKEWLDLGATSDHVAFSCVGRWKKGRVRNAFQNKNLKKGKGPCNYAGGGLFKINPVTVVMKDGSELSVFEFASDQKETK